MAKGRVTDMPRIANTAHIANAARLVETACATAGVARMTAIARMAKEARETISLMEQRCIGCNACAGRCDLLDEFPGSFQALCAESHEALRDVHGIDSLYRELNAHGKLYRFLRSCFGCDRCTAHCPQGLALSTPWKAWRALLRAGNYLNNTDASLVKVDCTWDCFSVFRAVQGIDYSDLPLLSVEAIDARTGGQTRSDARQTATLPQAETLFFPGCSLCTYAPELTRTAFDWLEKNTGPCLLATQCCSFPLDCVGEVKRAAAWRRRVIDAAQRQGVKRIVCVCPGCEGQLSSTCATYAPDMEFVSLARLLADAGVRVEASALTGLALPVAVSDSCQDRSCLLRRAQARASLGQDCEDDSCLGEPSVDQHAAGSCSQQSCGLIGPHGAAIRELIENIPSVTAPYAGIDTLCCGAGGAVGTYDAELPRQRTRHKLQLFQNAGAKTLITACPTCAYTYAFELWTSSRENDTSWQEMGVVNYLEAAFSQRIDWPAVFSSLYDMWEGEHAAWVAEQLLP